MMSASTGLLIHQRQMTTTPIRTSTPVDGGQAYKLMRGPSIPQPEATSSSITSTAATSQPTIAPHVPTCVLTHKDLRDPVVASDGYTYERRALTELLDSSAAPRSPVTDELLDKSIIIPNHAIAHMLVMRRMPTICPAPPPSGQRPLNCRINSDLQEMERLHRLYGWIPGDQQIRPTPETIERKAHFFESVMPQYQNECDFVLHSIFGLEAKLDPSTSKLFVSHPAVLTMKPHSLRKTLPNLFPYQVPPGTLHFVHWAYPHFSLIADIDDAETNEAIKRDLTNHFGPESVFEFVWNVNPKMSLPHDRTGCMHAHVFVHLCGCLIEQ